MDSNKQEYKIKSAEFYFDIMGRFPHYRMEIGWHGGKEFAFNIYESEYWCERLKYYLGVKWKTDMYFFSNEHVEEAQEAVKKMIGLKAGVVTSKKGFQYLIYL